MASAHFARVLPLIVVGTSCTALLGVEEGILDAGDGGTSQASSTASLGASTSGASTSGSATTSTATAGGSGGDGGGASASTTTTAGGGHAGGAGSGTGGEGGAGGEGAGGGVGGGGAGGEGTGGRGGAAGTGGQGGAGGHGGDATGAGGSGGEGGSCELPAVDPCPGVQPNTFTLASDLTSFWTVVAPSASITGGGLLRLQIGTGTTEARIEAMTALSSPVACGAWLHFVMPSNTADTESGLAVATESGTFSAYHVAGELRVRDAVGGLASTPYGVDTALVRARFDVAGDLWFDASPDGDCWVDLDGPFGVGDAPVDLQIFMQRSGTTGNAASTFDDFSR